MPTRRTFIAMAAGAATGLTIPRAIASAKRLVLIHGRQQQGLDQAELRASWMKSLSDALGTANLELPQGLQVEFPYYGDELDRFVALSKLPLATDITSRGDDTQDDLLAFQSQLVDEMIKKAGVPDELVVVAFDLLRRQNSTANVPLLVTLGSPLGVMQIRNAFRPLKYPRGVQGWYNAYDERDYVALYPLDEKNFALTPAIENYGAVQNQPPTRHAILDYLSNPKVAGRIHGAF